MNPADLILFRRPRREDAAAIWRLVRDSGVLDVNSAYAYLLLCDRFSSTCAVAIRGERAVGFATAFVPPGQPDTLFVWQVGVDREHRGQGIGLGLLRHLLSLPAAAGAHYLETHVTPSNHASRAMFRALARQHGADVSESVGFPAELFPDADHEAERLLRIGPLQRGNA